MSKKHEAAITRVSRQLEKFLSDEVRNKYKTTTITCSKPLNLTIVVELIKSVCTCYVRYTIQETTPLVLQLTREAWMQLRCEGNLDRYSIYRDPSNYCLVPTQTVKLTRWDKFIKNELAVYLLEKGIVNLVASY
jgi:hypothetical protein